MVVMQVKIYLPEVDTCIGLYWWRDGLVEKIRNTEMGGTGTTSGEVYLVGLDYAYVGA